MAFHFFFFKIIFQFQLIGNPISHTIVNRSITKKKSQPKVSCHDCHTDVYCLGTCTISSALHLTDSRCSCLATFTTMSMIREAFKRFGRSAYAHKLRHYRRVAFSEKYLLFTNVTISLTLSSVGDILEQQYERYTGSVERWDPKRTLNMAISGVTVGVICHHWYKFLDRRLVGRSFKIVLQKVVLDQIICSPLYISMFFVTLGLLEKQSKDEIIGEIKSKAWKLYAAEWTIWPPAQIINFYFLPNKYRVLYDNTISLGYDVFTSKVKYQTP